MTKRMDGLAESTRKSAPDQQERQDAYVNSTASSWKAALGIALLIAGLLLASVANIMAVLTSQVSAAFVRIRP